jgi:uncharacterized iron-regulated membrane protein
LLDALAANSEVFTYKKEIILDKWFSLKKAAALVLQIHSGSIFGLEAIYPLLNGLGLVGLLLTGLSMTSLFRKRSQKEA